MATKFGVAIAKKNTEIIRVFDSPKEASTFGRQFVDVSRSQGIVFCFSAEFDGGERADKQMRIYGICN